MKMEEFAKEMAQTVRIYVKQELDKREGERQKEVFELRMAVQALQFELKALKEKAGA